MRKFADCHYSFPLEHTIWYTVFCSVAVLFNEHSLEFLEDISIDIKGLAPNRDPTPIMKGSVYWKLGFWEKIFYSQAS